MQNMARNFFDCDMRWSLERSALEQAFISYRTKRPTNSALWCRVDLARSIESFIPTRLIPIFPLWNLHKRRPQRRNQMSRRERSLAPMQNAILATRRVVVDTLTMPHRRDVAAPSSSSPGQDDQPSHPIGHRSFWNCAAEQLTNHRK